jgi:hypothetical protein
VAFYLQGTVWMRTWFDKIAGAILDGAAARRVKARDGFDQSLSPSQQQKSPLAGAFLLSVLAGLLKLQTHHPYAIVITND